MVVDAFKKRLDELWKKSGKIISENTNRIGKMW